MGAAPPLNDFPVLQGLQAAYSAMLLGLSPTDGSNGGYCQTPGGPEITRAEGLSTVGEGIQPLNSPSTCTLTTLGILTKLQLLSPLQYNVTTLQTPADYGTSGPWVITLHIHRHLCIICNITVNSYAKFVFRTNKSNATQQTCLEACITA